MVGGYYIQKKTLDSKIESNTKSYGHTEVGPWFKVSFERLEKPEIITINLHGLLGECLATILWRLLIVLLRNNMRLDLKLDCNRRHEGFLYKHILCHYHYIFISVIQNSYIF